MRRDAIAAGRWTFSRDDLLRVLLIAVAYLAAHGIAFAFPDSRRLLMAVWPPGGVALASLLLNRRKLWAAIIPALFAAGLAADLVGGRPLLAGIGYMIANMGESVGCAYFMTRICGPEVRFRKVRDIAALIVAVTLINACTAALGAAFAPLEGTVPYGTFWLMWFVADGLGILIVAPLIVVWSDLREAFAGLTWPRAVEAAFALLVFCAIASLTFQAPAVRHVPSAQPYMLAVLLVWPAIRFGQRGVTAWLIFLAAITVTSRAVVTGPILWGGATWGERLLGVQIFLGFCAVAGMILAASYAERHAAEQMANEGQARLRALGDDLPNSIVYQLALYPDGSRQFVYISAAVERLHGFSREEVLNDPFLLYSRVLEEDRGALTEAERISASRMAAHNVTVRVLGRDGEVRWMRLSSSPRRLPDGTILWDGIETDVTEEKLVDLALRESEERYRTLVHNTEMPVTVVSDGEGRILFANRPVAEFLDCPEEQLIGMSMAGFWADTEDRRRYLESIHENGKLSGYEARFVSLKGEERWAKIGATIIDYRGKRAILSVHSDITELKRVQHKLDAERTFLRSLLHAIPDRVWLKDPDGRYLICNATVVRVLNTTEAELIGKRDADVFPADEVEQFRQEDELVVRSGGPRMDRQWLRTGEDGRRLMETIRTPVYDSAGQLIGVLGVARDITAIREAEEVLHERLALQKQLATTASLLPGAIYSYRLAPDGKTSYTYVSPMSEEICGLEPGRVGRDRNSLRDIIVPDDLRRLAADLRESARSMSEFRESFRVRHPQKGEIWLESMARPVPSPDGGIVWHGFLSDITQRKNAEAAAAAEAVRRRILIEESKDGVVVLDINGRLREWNRSFAAMVGYSAEELGGLFVWDWDTQLSREQLLQRLQNITAASETFKTRHRRKNGTFYDVEISASAADVGGEILIFCILRDITARLKAEKERDQLQRELLETRRLESVGVLAGGMAHEFNNLLTVINGYAALLRRGLPSNDSSLASISAIQSAGERAANLTQQLLSYGRRRLVSPKSIDLNLVINDGRRIWQRLLSPNIEVILEPAPSLKLVMADADQIAEVIVHLVRNANDAMPDGGVLTVRTGNVEIDREYAARHGGAYTGEFVLVTVTDTGVGMDERTRERVFEPFFTTKERALASGLGLPTVHGIVAQHHGWVTVESVPGGGSSFHIYLPALATVPTMVERTMEIAAAGGQPPTVLVVEDMDSVREFALLVLNSMGYNTLEAPKGADAVKLVEAYGKPIDLLITDVIMPGMPGTELARHLRARMPSLKVLYVSGYPEEILSHQGLQMDDTHFVQKPYEATDLSQKVLEILGRDD